MIPLGWLRLFDPSEPLFEQMGWHPMVIHRCLAVLLGHFYWITQKQRNYQGKQIMCSISKIYRY
ncbi:MAG: hypothetical protein F6J98_20090 [Moorea sp. SIO4G2]|uniref:hypothetical protein n=1 Tax=Moorena sp. SIO4A1 TaxID=2607835 RepID=UPI0013F97898|nr:hypothetical protein [Moorena sp. SIO4A1]NEO62608.1 hypothetical protein [Moorena sp. SIO4G2]NEQ63347.1 hypothetical protein [Moorena sp. SIO4A1]